MEAIRKHIRSPYSMVCVWGALTTRELLCSPVRTLVLSSCQNITSMVMLADDASQSPATDMLLDVPRSQLGNRLAFLGRIGVLPTIPVQLADPEADSSARVCASFAAKVF